MVVSSPERLGPLDAAIVAILLAVALFMMTRAGSRRGVDLMPWPDGLEYAAAAVSIDRGMGPVLHFAGYSYPSRYTEGYPLILATVGPLLGGRVDRMYLVTMALGLLAIASLYLLAFRMFDRTSATISAATLALSPLFLTYSTLVLSDVPTMTMTILAGLAFFHAGAAEEATSPATSLIAATLCGLLAGFTVMIRPTNATILIGIAGAMLLIRSRRRFEEMVPAAVGFGVAFAIFPIWQAWTNAQNLGGASGNGYVFWVPEVYGSFSKTFSPRFLFGATMPGNPWGNVASYMLTLVGLDGMLGDPGDPRYLMYPFAGAAFAVVGIVTGVQSKTIASRRVMWFGLIFPATLLTLYLFYFFTEVAFILPATFALFIASGYGVMVANRAMRDARARARKTSRDNAIIAGVVALDLMLAVSMLAETAVRAAASPQASKMVPTLTEFDSRLEPNAIIVSNISLLFLDLYIAKPKTEFIGLNSIDPGGEFTDYHLARLYAKKAAGWSGPVPPVLFAGPHLDEAEAKSLADAVRAGHPAYLLMTPPERQEYADLLKDEVAQLTAAFNLDAVANTDCAALFRLTPR